MMTNGPEASTASPACAVDEGAGARFLVLERDGSDVGEPPDTPSASFFSWGFCLAFFSALSLLAFAFVAAGVLPSFAFTLSVQETPSFDACGPACPWSSTHAIDFGP